MKITVGPPFYNQVNVPIGMVLLALIGIGPVIAWRRSSWSNLKKNFTKPVLAGAIGGAILFPFVPLTDKSEIFHLHHFHPVHLCDDVHADRIQERHRRPHGSAWGVPGQCPVRHGLEK